MVGALSIESFLVGRLVQKVRLVICIYVNFDENIKNFYNLLTYLLTFVLTCYMKRHRDRLVNFEFAGCTCTRHFKIKSIGKFSVGAIAPLITLR